MSKNDADNLRNTENLKLHPGLRLVAPQRSQAPRVEEGLSKIKVEGRLGEVVLQGST